MRYAPNLFICRRDEIMLRKTGKCQKCGSDNVTITYTPNPPKGPKCYDCMVDESRKSEP